MSLPLDLKELVFNSVMLLGEVIKVNYGQEAYDQIERLRSSFKMVRDDGPSKLYEVIEHSYSELKNAHDERLSHIAHAYSLMLELINCCEGAYRVHHLRKKNINLQPSDQQIIFVLTSHPTEARSKNFLLVVEKITECLERSLIKSFDSQKEELKFLLSLALSVEITKHQKPTIKDEAQEIYHRILNRQMLDKQVEMIQTGIEVSFRTWAGGDKDGHPGVGSSEMLSSLQGSRVYLLKYIKDILLGFQAEILLAAQSSKISLSLDSLVVEMDLLKKIEAGDGQRIQKLRKKFNSFILLSRNHHLHSPQLDKIKSILWLYPALVLPLEVREDSDVIGEALKDKKQNIFKMLNLLKKISKGYDPKWYVRGFIISMCQTEMGLANGISLVMKTLGQYAIPVVPLFENEQGMTNALQILKFSMKKFNLVQEHSNRWNNKFEIMIGYSDSSKENGVLAGRLQLEKAIRGLDVYLTQSNLRPVFFHGSGGSISRGGGSTKEQIAWWPKSSLSVFKMTVQGESIQRNIGHPVLIESMVSKIIDEFHHFSTRNSDHSQETEVFSDKVKRNYRDLVSQSKFQELVMNATPYQFLNQLKLGSRPDKRSAPDTFSLRAIPWILCWTQTRILLPVWWGVGQAWSEMSEEEKKKIIKDFNQSPLLTSYLKHLGFTLEKIRAPVWEFLINHASIEKSAKSNWIESFRQELSKVEIFFKEVSGESEHLWFRPWLKESIYFRSSMIHPLNVIQKIAIERADANLLRTTVAGISCGMMTTG